MKNVVLKPSKKSDIPIQFTKNGIIEHVELDLMNVRPPKVPRRFINTQWDKVSLSVKLDQQD
jgi:hypothetical protein